MTQIPISKHRPAPPSASPYATLHELRSSHNVLLKRQRDAKEVPLDDIQQFIERACATGALLDLEAHREAAQALIDYWTTSAFRAYLHSDHAASLLEFDPALAPDLPKDACPYVGLEAFHEKNSEIFFGRQLLMERIVDALRTHRAVAVLGMSGSGKSSVVMGGVLPMLRRGAIDGSDAWQIFEPIVPGSDPLRSLARLFTRHDVDEEIARLTGDRNRLKTLLDGAQSPALVVIDQFEELFTLCSDVAAREAFAANLATAASAPGLRHAVMITMRSDFDSYLVRLEELRGLLEHVAITPMTAPELRDAIERPAAMVGLKFEEGVVDALIADTLGEPAALPLLQFSLLKLWDSKERNRVTFAAYKKLGSGRHALEKTANAFFDTLLIEDQTIARRILLRIVRVDFGAEMVRNRMRKRDLFRPGDNVAAIENVLDRMIKARLVRFTPGEASDDDQIEVAHESLVRNWPTLADWLEKEKADLKTLQYYETRAEEWSRLERMSGFLDEMQLREARRWLTSSIAIELGYSNTVCEFIDASAQRLVEEETRVNEERERRLAEENARIAARKRLRMSLIAGAIVAAMAAVVGVMQIRMQRERQASAIKEQKRLASEAERKLTDSLARQEERERYTQTIEETQRQLQAQFDELTKQKKKTDQALDKAENARRRAVQAEEKAKQETRRALEAEAKAKEAEGMVDVAIDRLIQMGDELAKKGNIETETEVDPARLADRSDLQLLQRHRPLRIGSSIGVLGTEYGTTFCCIVQRPDGTRYLLGLPNPFTADGGRIVQPAEQDGGTPADVIATITQWNRENDRRGVLARLEPGLKLDPEVPLVGTVTGFAYNVPEGTPVRLIGRDAGILGATVLGTDNDGDYVLQITTDLGDLGAPVFLSDGRLIGLVRGGFSEMTWVVPIEDVIEGLDVKLATP
jgi:hypothetical protein